MKRGKVSKTFHVGPGKISADVWPLLQSVKATFFFVCVLERSSRRGCGSRADSSRESWEGWQLDQREIHVFCSVEREVQRFLNGMTRLFVICVLGDINAPPMNIPISETLLIQSGRGQEQHDNMYKYCRNIQKKQLRMEPHILKQWEFSSSLFGSGEFVYKPRCDLSCRTQIWSDQIIDSFRLLCLMRIITSMKRCGIHGWALRVPVPSPLLTHTHTHKLYTQAPVLKLLMLLSLP